MLGIRLSVEGLSLLLGGVEFMLWTWTYRNFVKNT